MGRIRTIKPSFYQHADLYDAEKQSGFPLRVAYSGLWTQCDREGRFKWRPRELKLGVLPYDEVDFSHVLDALETRGYIVRYEVGGESYGYLPSWKLHQFVNNRESASQLPEPPLNLHLDASMTRVSRADDARGTAVVKERKGNGGKEGEARERATPPPIQFPKSAGSDGEFLAATHLMQDLKLASTAGDIRVIAQVIALEAPDRGGAENATEWLKERALEARSRGEHITVFWFKDRKFDKGQVANPAWAEFIAAGGTRDE